MLLNMPDGTAKIMLAGKPAVVLLDQHDYRISKQ
jgi:hypothetical protein